MAKTNLKHKAYTEIKQKIILGDIEGGDPIYEQILVEQLGISRTPIREALSMLQHEQLVEIYPKQGVFVTRVSYKDVVDIYSLRILMESYAVSLATDKIDREELKRQEEIWSTIDNEEDPLVHVQKDRDLHSCIVEATGNKYLIKYLHQLYDQANRIRHISLKRSRERISQTHTEHLRIVKFMLEGDCDSAGEAMRQHLEQARDTALRFFS